jgi:hypothetical protein
VDEISHVLYGLDGLSNDWQLSAWASDLSSAFLFLYH